MIKKLKTLSRKAAGYAIERQLVKKKYGDLFDDLAALFYETDPMGINAGCNPDEYEPEVGTILPKLAASCSVQDVEKIIYREFCKWFGGSEVVRQREKYKPIAARAWELWNDRNKEKEVDTIASAIGNK